MLVQSRTKCLRIEQLKCRRDIIRTHHDFTTIVALECKGTSRRGSHVEGCWNFEVFDTIKVVVRCELSNDGVAFELT